MKTRHVTTRELAADPDRIAPVSGGRCRGCGANAKLRPPTERWAIYQSAAWCPPCVNDLIDELGAARDAEAAG